MNDIQIKATNQQLEKLTLDAAQGLLDKTQIAALFKTHSRKVKPNQV
jgi:prophage maintenance system killer protein